MEVNITGKLINSDRTASALISFLKNNVSRFGLEESELYYDFPVLKDNEGIVVRSRIMLVSKKHGVIIIEISDAHSREETALQKEGITLAPGDIEVVMADADSIDRLGQNIFELTGQKLAPETLVKVVSGADTDKIAQRLSYVTGIPQSQILLHLKEASSVDDLMTRLDIDKERFLDIISLDEDVFSFQEKIGGLITHKPSKISGIEIFEDLDVDRFRSRIKRS